MYRCVITKGCLQRLRLVKCVAANEDSGSGEGVDAEVAARLMWRNLCVAEVAPTLAIISAVATSATH